MKSRKTIVFWIINIELILLFIALVLWAKDVLPALGPTIIIMIVGNGAAYIGGNVFSAWQKSKYYQPILDKNVESQAVINYGSSFIDKRNEPK